MGNPPPLTSADVDGYRTSLSNWGRWGDKDQLGTLNLLRPEHTVAAAALLRTGRRVSCARPLPTEPAVDNLRPVEHHMVGTATEGYGADWFGMAPHGYATSHLDALCHIFWDGRLYGGRPAEIVTAHGALELGIHQLADGVVGRGVLLDIPLELDVDALEPGTPITVDDLEAAEARAGVQVGTGDVLLVRTGRWRWRAEHGPWDPRAQLAGLHASCLPWLHEREVAVIGADTAQDVVPSGYRMRNPVHLVGIVAMGLWLIDNCDLEPLLAACRERGRWSFLFTLAPLRIAGGTGSPVNPLAVF
jgi:kynurenine formamidase